MRYPIYGLVFSAVFSTTLADNLLRDPSPGKQVPFDLPQTPPQDAVERHAFFVFNSIHHLLRQWGNTISPNGFSFTRGTIPTGTNLYHARGVSPSFAALRALLF